MARFIQYDRHQQYLLPPSVDEWLPEDPLARYIVEVIDQLDLSKLTSRYSRSGSEAYHPALLLALLETVVKAFRPPDAIKYSHAKPQEISLERRID
jgi:transposase